MCLDVVYRGKKKKEALDKLPETMAVWKVAEERPNEHKYFPPFFGRGRPYRAGLNKTRSRHCDIGYKVAYHFWRHGTDAKAVVYENWCCDGVRVIRCMVQKKDIVAIGEQWDGLVIVATQANFPKYKPRRKTG